jgi:hypothetical protein
VHLPNENGESSAFLICDIAVRPIPESTLSSALLNWRCGNFAARKIKAAIVVVLAKELSSITAAARLVEVCFAILFSLVFTFRRIRSYEQFGNVRPMTRSSQGNEFSPRRGAVFRNLSKIFAGH